ncbi:MAG: transcription elongation factor GreA [candidate division Zixibacteria bacterium]|jgi:transcription elongation factor GreA|nr:transcription elongation factor GreA [candidate division Zixibacteria bacterium]
MTERIYMSKDGLRKLEQELKKLKFEDRPEIVAEIKRAREHGDLSENAEYHAAKERQAHLERRIAELEDKLSRAHSIDTDQIPSDKVYLYAKVVVRDERDGEEIEYTIAPPDEVDIDNDIISVKSPIGQGLLGKAVGETAEIQVPAGLLKYTVVRISRD